MMKRTSIKYYFLLGIITYIMCVVLDLFHVPSGNKFSVLFGISSLVFSIVIVFGYAVIIMIDEYKDDTFEYFFGNYHYGWYWTFSLVPCIIYAFVFDYFAYMGFCAATFIALEHMRTKQNDFYEDYYVQMKAEEAQNAKRVVEEVQIK